MAGFPEIWNPDLALSDHDLSEHNTNLFSIDPAQLSYRYLEAINNYGSGSGNFGEIKHSIDRSDGVIYNTRELSIDILKHMENGVLSLITLV